LASLQFGAPSVESVRLSNSPETLPLYF
jgi:hypothetical protein